MPKNKGFTLIELLVVIAIIGLLASLIMVSLGSSQRNARNAKRMADIRTLQSAAELCRIDGGSAPLFNANVTWPDILLLTCGGTEKIGDYLASNAPPRPPKKAADCSAFATGDCYFLCSDGTDYLIGASQMEKVGPIDYDVDNNKIYAANMCVNSSDYGLPPGGTGIICTDGASGNDSVLCLGR